MLVFEVEQCSIRSVIVDLKQVQEAVKVRDLIAAEDGLPQHPWKRDINGKLHLVHHFQEELPVPQV